MDQRRMDARYWAMLEEDNVNNGISDYVLFPPRRHFASHVVAGVRPLTAEICDLNTTSGLALSQMGHDPLLTSFFANLDRRDRDV